MAEKTYELIIYEKKDGVATITLNRPKVLNALNSKLLEEVWDALRDAEADEGVRVIVITGAGDRAFSAGADIPELLEKSPVEARTYSIWLKDVLRYMERLQKPIIAKIRGFCLGGGLELAMACDFRIASTDARFGQPEVNLGIIPGAGGTQRLTRLIGRTKAMELCMTGDHYTAEELYNFGLLNKVVPPEELDKATDELIKKLMAKSAATLGIIKLAVNKGIEMPLEEALFYEAECFGIARSLEDATEGLKAFLEKRKPVFKGK